MSGLTVCIGPWAFFANAHGRFAPVRHWGYRFYANHGRPVRSFIALWCELSWWRA